MKALLYEFLSRRISFHARLSHKSIALKRKHNKFAETVNNLTMTTNANRWSSTVLTDAMPVWPDKYVLKISAKFPFVCFSLIFFQKFLLTSQFNRLIGLVQRVEIGRQLQSVVFSSCLPLNYKAVIVCLLSLGGNNYFDFNCCRESTGRSLCLTGHNEITMSRR